MHTMATGNDNIALAMEFTHMPRWLLKPKKVVTWSR